MLFANISNAKLMLVTVLNILELILIQTKNQISAKYLFFESFFLILPQHNRQFDFNFFDKPDKKCKCSNLWQKK